MATQGLAGSLVQLSHATKFLLSMPPSRGTGLLASSLPGFQPPILEEGPQQELLHSNHSMAGRAAHSQAGHRETSQRQPWLLIAEAAGAPTLLKLPLLAASIRSSAKKEEGLGSEKSSCNTIYLTLEPIVRHQRHRHEVYPQVLTA